MHVLPWLLLLWVHFSRLHSRRQYRGILGILQYVLFTNLVFHKSNIFPEFLIKHRLHASDAWKLRTVEKAKALIVETKHPRLKAHHLAIPGRLCYLQPPCAFLQEFLHGVELFCWEYEIKTNGWKYLIVGLWSPLVYCSHSVQIVLCKLCSARVQSKGSINSAHVQLYDKGCYVSNQNYRSTISVFWLLVATQQHR